MKEISDSKGKYIEKILSKIGAKVADAAELSQRAAQKAIEAQKEIEELFLFIGDED